MQGGGGGPWGLGSLAAPVEIGRCEKDIIVLKGRRMPTTTGLWSRAHEPKTSRGQVKVAVGKTIHQKVKWLADGHQDS